MTILRPRTPGSEDRKFIVRVALLLNLGAYLSFKKIFIMAKMDREAPGVFVLSGT